MTEMVDKNFASLNNLYELYYEKLVKYCGSLLNYDRDAALECVQNTFLAAVTSKAILETHANPVEWLYKTAYNFVKRTQKSVAINLKRMALLDENIPYNISLDIDGDTEISDEKAAEYIEQIFAQLTEVECTLYNLYYTVGLSTREISSKMGISEVACRVRLFRLRKHIIELVQSLDLD